MKASDRKHEAPASESNVPGKENPNHTVAPEKEGLQAYLQAKLKLAELLRHAVETLSILGVRDEKRAYEELLVKLAEDRFVLAVVGQFNRGKSSLMNAIVSQNLLPTGILPVTSAITTLKYGPSEKLTVYRQTAIFGDELPLSDLSEYITEKGNPHNLKKVTDATIELPLSFLRKGIEFVDTPGIGSAIQENTEITYNFIPQCDAILFVTSVESPISAMEVEFLESISEYVNKIFYVINKVDLVTQDEQAEVLRYVESAIQENTGDQAPRIFPLSSTNGIAGQLSKKHDLYESSGLQNLKEALALFLTTEKGSQFLVSVAQKALRLMDSDETAKALTPEALQQRTDVLLNESSKAILRNPLEAASTLENIKQRLLAFTDKFMIQETIKGLNTYKPMPMKNLKKAKALTDCKVNFSSNNIEISLQGKGCPVCQHLTSVASDFFALWQYLISSDEQVQNSFAAEYGFCPTHTWQLLAYSSPRGASIGFTKYAELLANRLRSNITSVAELIKNIDDCRVCKLLQKEEKNFIDELSTYLHKEDNILIYNHSEGLCLRHLGLLVSQVSKEEKAQLMADTAKRFDESAEDMQEYVLKYDATRRNLINKRENEAYLTAVRRIVGEKGMLFPWKK